MAEADDRARAAADAPALTLPAHARTAPRAPPRRRRRRPRRSSAPTTSMAVAAQTALPGDTLYPIKRGIESAQTGLSRRRAPQGRTRCSPAPAAGSTRSPTLSRERRRRRRRRDRRHPRRPSPTRPTTAADLLLADYADTGDRDARSPSCATSPPTSMDTPRPRSSRPCRPTARDELLARGPGARRRSTPRPRQPARRAAARRSTEVPPMLLRQPLDGLIGRTGADRRAPPRQDGGRPGDGTQAAARRRRSATADPAACRPRRRHRPGTGPTAGGTARRRPAQRPAAATWPTA